MRSWLLTRSLGLLLSVLGTTAMVVADEALSTLDLVSEDAAFCLEVPHLSETWTMLESSPLMDRIRAIPAYQRMLESHGFQQWQAVEEHVSRQSGKKLSSQLRALFGKSLVVAIYVPSAGEPEGILIGEATDAVTVERALTTWNKLDPNEVISARTHHGVAYHQRKKHANANESIFVATLDRWFAASDHESLIQDVIDRFPRTTGVDARSTAAGSLRQSPLFSQNRQRFKTDGAAYLHVNARPWDRGLEEASRDEHELINPAAVWKHVSAVSGCLQFDRGVVCEAIVELDTTRLPGGWSQFVATAATDPSWSRRVPPEAILAISGHLELTPVIRHLLSQVAPGDQTELVRNRRIVQSLLGGQELFDVVLPTLARNFCGCLVTRKDDQTKRVVLDGSLGFSLNTLNNSKFSQDTVHGLETALNLLAAYFSAEGPNIVTVQREQTGSALLRWLSESAPFPIAFGLKGQNLVVAGSQERLRKSLDSLDRPGPQTRLADYAKRYFPQANQLIWFDTAQTRQLLERSGPDIAHLFSHGSEDESSRLANRFEQVRPVLGLIDSLFIAGQVESDHIRVVFGGGLDDK